MHSIPGSTTDKLCHLVHTISPAEPQFPICKMGTVPATSRQWENQMAQRLQSTSSWEEIGRALLPSQWHFPVPTADPEVQRIL